MAAEWALTSTADLGDGVKVHMSAGPAGYTCDWTPDMPAKLTSLQKKKYRRTRNALIATVAERMGGSALIVEI